MICFMTHSVNYNFYRERLIMVLAVKVYAIVYLILLHRKIVLAKIILDYLLFRLVLVLMKFVANLWKIMTIIASS